MKKIIFIITVILIMFISIFTYSQQQYTVAWNPVVMEGEISYELFLRKLDQSPDEGVLIGSTVETEYSGVLAGEGTFIIGVRTVRVFDGQTFYSDINWSNVDGEWTPYPFYLVFYQAVPAPKNLRIK